MQTTTITITTTIATTTSIILKNKIPNNKQSTVKKAGQFTYNRAISFSHPFKIARINN